MSRLILSTAAATAVLALSACGDSNSPSLAVPASYNFDSQFAPGESSVNYSGQICRHTLITALTTAVRDEAEISKAEYRGQAVPYFDDTIAGDLAAQSTATILGTSLPVPEAVDTLGKLCGSKHLQEKFAGNDSVTDHRDWTTEFAGINGESHAENHLRNLLSAVSQQAASGTAPAGVPHYVSGDGIDYAQMIQKFLLGAVVFAQGTDDYLDNDANTPGKGLLAAFERDGDKPYAKLEHQIDEGYGYFGAARAYASRSDEDNRSGVIDDNGDGLLDPLSEYNFGASTNAAKRDVGADPSSPTDFTDAAFGNLTRLRALISNAGVNFADLPQATQTEVLAARDAAVQAWEGAIAATVVHYINDTLADLDKIGTTEFSLADLAKHFSEMKGFALGLQFNPRSPLLEPVSSEDSSERFVRLHELLRDNPPCVAGVCTNEPQYRTDLLAARALMGEAYGFAQANLENW